MDSTTKEDLYRLDYIKSGQLHEKIFYIKSESKQKPTETSHLPQMQTKLYSF